MTSQARNVPEYLLEGKAPGRIALHLLSGDHTYGEIAGCSSAVAAYLCRGGGGPGDRVMLAAENSLFWVAAYLGTLQAGMVAVPVPPAMPAEEFDYIRKTSGAAAVLADGRFMMNARETDCFRGCRILTDRPVAAVGGAVSQCALGDVLGRFAGAGASRAGAGRDSLAALMFTSGSTGKPRGVMVTHGNIIANTDSIIEYLRLDERDRIMGVLPFHYCFGTSLLHTHLRVGASLVVDSRFMYPEVILNRMQETQCTGFAGVPSHFQILLRHSSLAVKRFPHLRCVQQAGGHLAPSFVRELRAALPEAKIYIMYGQTEATARLSYLPPELVERKAGSIGKGIPGVLLSVVNEAGIAVGPGEVGEIVAEGENVAKGYWQDPEESARAFRDCRLYTGDLATVDEDGFIFIAGRAKDFLKCGGKRVSARAVEEKVLRFEGVLEAAVIGVPDDVLGDAVKLFVVPSGLASTEFQDRLRLHCRAVLAPALVPREIAVLGSLPKNSSGKVLKEELRATARA